VPQPDDQRLIREKAIKRAVAERIRELREDSNLSQDEMAARAHLHRAHYGFVESERREPKLGTLIRIAEAHDISLGELLAISPKKSNETRAGNCQHDSERKVVACVKTAHILI